MSSSRDPTPAPQDDERSFAARLRAKYGEGVDPEVSLGGETAGPGEAENESGSATSDLLRRLSDHGLKSPRYRLEDEVARGGMGAILRVWDEDLRRHLAMKVVLGKGEAPGSSGTPQVDTRVLARFLEEAQVTGQLDHPGIVPVHELGLDQDGRVYFTMKLVKGRDLKAIFDLVFAAKDGWNETRALSVILRACEAVAYAHKKGVIHRDLKPANVMVGSFGEVFVMDWGLARVLGRKDSHDIRIAPEFASALSSVKTERRDEREDLSDSPIVTMDGDVMGTPAYMAPEQARGQIEKLGQRSDVYSMGALLYHLLAGHAPYIPPGARLSARTILSRVIDGPPYPLATIRRDVPAELVAIVEKAMAREAEQRYADTLSLAEDLRAFLEHRVVGAYEAGAWAETRKWVQRNKPLAASLAAAVLLLVAGLSASLVFKARADARAADLLSANETIQARNTELAATTRAAQENEILARANEMRATGQERIATKKAIDVLSLSAIQDLKDLEERADALWPADPERVPEYEAWIADARALIEGRPADPDKGLKRRPSLAEHEAQLGEIRRRAKQLASDEEVGEQRTYAFEDGEDRWWHAQLSKLVADLKAFKDEELGGLYSSGTSEEHGWGIVRRAEFARTIGERSVEGPEAKRRWEEAIAAISTNAKYGGLKLPSQLGLLPIGADPESGLWEFAHLASGEPAERGGDGKLILKEEMGLVLVLIPGGPFLMGAQSTDPTEPNHDPQASSNESPVHEVTLSAYFLSKYEMTQGQWERFTGRNPSTYGPGNKFADHQHNLLHPVEQVTWTQCMEVMSRLGLSLPSEAQWECACRGGTDTAWWTGADRESLRGQVNIADRTASQAGATWGDIKDWPDLEDGWVVHAAAGSFPANPFGLHEVHGNVWEWCLDGYDGSFYSRSPKSDPVASTIGARDRVARGGCFSSAASDARSAYRDNGPPVAQSTTLGLRPARASHLSASPLHQAGK